MSVINPLAMKKYASTAIRKGKTDKLDSVRIVSQASGLPTVCFATPKLQS